MHIDVYVHLYEHTHAYVYMIFIYKRRAIWPLRTLSGRHLPLAHSFDRSWDLRVWSNSFLCYMGVFCCLQLSLSCIIFDNMIYDYIFVMYYICYKSFFSFLFIFVTTFVLIFILILMCMLYYIVALYFLCNTFSQLTRGYLQSF